MRAAVVEVAGKPPAFAEFPDPDARPGETIVAMRASAVNPLTLMRAGSAHYSASTPVPFVAGVDGVGRTEAGRAVYVPGTRGPYGTLAEKVPAVSARLVPLPDGLSDTLAAAVAIPGLSCWNPLVHRARIQPGESVMVHGATGAAGLMAIQIAKHLGARAVIALARNREKLAELGGYGADRTIPLDQPADAIRAAVRNAAREFQVGVVLDYLWGPTAVPLIAGVGGPDAPRGTATVRYVQIGAIAGPSIPLESVVLRSSCLEILGSGIGSSSPDDIQESLRDVFAATVSARFRLDTVVHPFAEVSTRWGSTGEGQRVVFSIP
ncbi:MAG TPA: zinc-binding dehydrogenase [Thermoplasmata archaeon]|nr:zinc-binding dehydrogenase [Thermoplasmata archaeon]